MLNVYLTNVENNVSWEWTAVTSLSLIPMLSGWEVNYVWSWPLQILLSKRFQSKQTNFVELQMHEGGIWQFIIENKVGN